MQVSRPGSSEEASNVNLSLLQLLTPEVLANPDVFYRALREHDAVHWDPYMHAWVVTSYSENITVLTSYSADRTPALEYLDQLGLSFMRPFSKMMLQQMLFMDGAKHARLRSICSAAMTPRKVEEAKRVIESTADGLMHKFAGKGA